MMGERTVMQEALFYEFSIERHVPADHLLRSIDRFVDLSDLRSHLKPFYSEIGRPSIDPELMIEVADGQQVGLALGKPCPRRRALTLRAVPVAAGVVGDAPLAAVLAGLDVTAERRGAAVLDCRHDLELGEAQVTCLGGPVSRPGCAEDVGDLDRGTHGSAVGRDSAGLNRPSLSSGLITVRTVLVATLA